MKYNMDDFRGKWKMGNNHKMKIDKTPLVGMFYEAIDLDTGYKTIGILKSFDLEKGTAILEDAEGEEFPAKIKSLRFYQM
jgi:hypothetical protein